MKALLSSNDCVSMESKMCNDYQNNKPAKPSVKYERWIVDYDSLRRPEATCYKNIKPLTSNGKLRASPDKNSSIYTHNLRPETKDRSSNSKSLDLITFNTDNIATAPFAEPLLCCFDRCQPRKYKYTCSAPRDKAKRLDHCHTFKQTKPAQPSDRHINNSSQICQITVRLEKPWKHIKNHTALFRSKTDVGETIELSRRLVGKNNMGCCIYAPIDNDNDHVLKRSDTLIRNAYSYLTVNRFCRNRSESQDSQVFACSSRMRTYGLPMKNTDTTCDNNVGSTMVPTEPTSTYQRGYISENRKQSEGFSLVRAAFCSSATTSGITPSGPELLYGMEGVPRPAYIDDLIASDISTYERDKQRVRNLDTGNRRQLFKRAACSLVEKVSFVVDDGRVLNTSLQVKPSWHRGVGNRGNVIRGEQLLTQRTTESNSGRGSDDLIAMGTLWSPGSNSNIASNTTSRDSICGQTIDISVKNKLAVLGSQNTNGSSNNSNSNNAASQRKYSNSRLNHNSSVSGISSTMFGMQLSLNSNNSTKDSKCISEPKYQDPLVGAPASFQQRLMELASLEADTIRWERAKKVKKKPKQDRDS